MIRGTTPDYVLTIPDVDLSDKTVLVTISQGHQQLNKSNADLIIEHDEHGSTIGFSLSQQETLAFRVGDADVQVKFIDATGYADGTDIKQIKVKRALYEKVIHYADGGA